MFKELWTYHKKFIEKKEKKIKINQVCEEDNFDQSIFENWSPQIAEKKRENLKTLIRTICDLAYNRGSNVPSDYDVFQGQTYQSFGLTRAYAQGIWLLLLVLVRVPKIVSTQEIKKFCDSVLTVFSGEKFGNPFFVQKILRALFHFRPKPRVHVDMYVLIMTECIKNNQWINCQCSKSHIPFF